METIQSEQGQGRVADAPSGHWVYRLLPRPLWPYAQLARWDRPIGWWLLLWPCWWSAALAATAHARPGDPLLTLLPNPWHLVLFLIGAIAMRGAGCTYNDIVDQDIDGKVARTRSRPLPSGQVGRKQAWIFLVLQALVGLAVLLQFNRFTILLGLASLAVVAIYPFMKRITYWPQLVLGLAFSWGALMGWAAAFGDLDAPAAAALCRLHPVDHRLRHDLRAPGHRGRRADRRAVDRAPVRQPHALEALMVLYGGALALFLGAFAPLRKFPCQLLPGCSLRARTCIARS